MRQQYRWKDRHDDLVAKRNPWPVRIEFALLVGAAALIAGNYLYDRLF
ncbi:hypothetical protein NUH86_15515 [Sphingobium sp. JS3065]|nr:hypothetical protein [Sphingobium sp. JS3065]UZW54867.1 hypothetical protein NUH86_15515 [Sphingobium sp. JS3065]